MMMVFMPQHFAFRGQRVMAILAALVGFCHRIRGSTNRQLVERVGALLQSPTPVGRRPTICPGSSVKDLIAKVARSNRYQLKARPPGRRAFHQDLRPHSRSSFKRSSTRICPKEVTARSSLSTAWRCFERALDDFMQAQLVASRT